MIDYKTIAESRNFIVLDKYTPEWKAAEGYQTEDALALVIHKLTGWKLSRADLFTDLTVLLASLSYIPVRRIAFSLVTVTVSSLLIDWVKEYTPKNGKTNV